MIELIIHKNIRYGIIISDKYDLKGANFFTEENDFLQLGYMKHSTGHTIQPHYHKQIERKINKTQEVLFIKTGKIRVDFYSENNQCIDSRILNSGDVLIILNGGHGFEVLESVEMYEVKQGPYVGVNDKVCFNPI